MYKLLPEIVLVLPTQVLNPVVELDEDDICLLKTIYGYQIVFFSILVHKLFFLYYFEIKIFKYCSLIIYNIYFKVSDFSEMFSFL